MMQGGNGTMNSSGSNPMNSINYGSSYNNENIQSACHSTSNSQSNPWTSSRPTPSHLLAQNHFDAKPFPSLTSADSQVNPISFYQSSSLRWEHNAHFFQTVLKISPDT